MKASIRFVKMTPDDFYELEHEGFGHETEDTAELSPKDEVDDDIFELHEECTALIFLLTDMAFNPYGHEEDVGFFMDQADMCPAIDGNARCIDEFKIDEAAEHLRTFGLDDLRKRYDSKAFIKALKSGGIIEPERWTGDEGFNHIAKAFLGLVAHFQKARIEGKMMVFTTLISYSP